MNWKTYTKYILIGLVLGMVPPLIAIHLLQDYQPKPRTREQHHARQTRDVNFEGTQESDHFKMFDKPTPTNAHSSNSRGSITQGKQLRNAVKKSTLEALSSIGALGFTKKIFVAVLSEESREKKMATAVGMTWGSDVIDFRFMYATKDDTVSIYSGKRHHQRSVPISVKEAYGKYHLLESLLYTCNKLTEDYRWYMVAMDTMYIDTEATLAFLDSLYHADSFVLGKDNGGTCRLDQGIILSKNVHQKFCENIKKCSALSDGTIGECLALATDTKCTDLAKASGTVYISEEETQNMATIKLSKKTLVYPNMETPQDMYQLHLQKVDMKISDTTQKLSLLRSSLDGNHSTGKSTQPTAFLKDWEGKLDRQTLNSTRPSHQMIDSDSVVVKTGCQNRNTVESMPYVSAKLYADDIISASEKNLKTFGYRRDVTAFQMIHEFYYTSPKMGRQSVSYVTVSQNYSVLNMLSTKVYKMRNVSMFTTVSTSEEVRVLHNYLTHLQQACTNISAFKVNCEVFVLVNESNSSITANISQVKRAVNNFISDPQRQDVSVVRIKVIPIDANESSDAFTVADIVPGNTVAHTTIHSAFDHEYLLRCYINSQPLNTVYSPVPYQLYKTDPHHQYNRPEFSVSSGHWVTNDYQTYCVSQETIAALSLTFFDIQNGLSHQEAKVQINRYPDPGLRRFPSFVM